MTLHDIQSVLRQLNALAEGWGAGREITLIERDLALDKLRQIYEAILLADMAPMQEVDSDPVDINLDEVLSMEVVDLTAIASEDAPEVQPRSGVEEPEIPQAPVLQSESEEKPTLKEEFHANLNPQPDPVVVAPTLFEVDESEGQRRHRQKQRVLMSLYDMEDSQPASAAAVVQEPVLEPVEAQVESIQVELPQVEPSEQPQVELPEPIQVEFPQEEQPESSAQPELPQVEHLVADVVEEELIIEEVQIEEITIIQEPVEKSGAVLGEVLNHDVKTLADQLPASHVSGAARRDRIVNLHKAIGINDRFLLIRDLFGGDAAEYDRAIAAIDAFDNMDDCLIYIAENYMWNPNSDGAKLLMELLERKLL